MTESRWQMTDDRVQMQNQSSVSITEDQDLFSNLILEQVDAFCNLELISLSDLLSVPCVLSSVIIRLQLLVQRFAGDAQSAGGFAFVAAGGLHGP